MTETQEQKVARVLLDRIELVPPDPAWPRLFTEEKARLLACLPQGLVVCVEHFGSTSIPGIWAKPVVDMLVEVSDLDRAREEAMPILEALGYDAFWRPQPQGATPPHYPWFIRRGPGGERTHHIHMTVADSTLWEGLAFRDYLRAYPDAAVDYERLKRDLLVRHPGDRVAYTWGKSDFVREIAARAAEH
ncbi:GrpB family protein [Desulfovibrio sp. Huiquan2017]|uniref:GrpB family protein n=1 Tax=Desulfovibrio sp. Huiquan2017 TaxID=2816861 RepID=UPI001A917C4A|nr:GrpB family protein [Desulfovibrio sp. Huiquan2017]